MRKILFIGPVFPEPTSSAAGVRTVGLLEDFLSRGDRILFASPSDQNAFASALQEKGIETFQIGPNDPAFDLRLHEFAPEVVVFDRFMLEEQFGWRVAEHAPKALRILDTIDLHFLRRARADRLATFLGAAVSNPSQREGSSIPDEQLGELYDSLDEIDTPDCLRELASIYRSDLSLILSTFEEQLLQNGFGVDPSLLLGLGFGYPEADTARWRPHAERKHFVSIGNFRHLPNRDAAFWLARVLWPKIREELSRHGEREAEFHLYGAYAPKEIMALDSPKDRIRVFGPAVESVPTLRDYRALLAPLRFGAGIKGKISDAWAAGIPVVTTPIGAEGMVEADAPAGFAGLVARTETEFADAAAGAYLDSEGGETLRAAGRVALGALYDQSFNRRKFLDRIDELLESPDRLADHRRQNLIGRILGADFSGRTKYFSKWIEEKNRNATGKGES